MLTVVLTHESVHDAVQEFIDESAPNGCSPPEDELCLDNREGARIRIEGRVPDELEIGLKAQRGGRERGRRGGKEREDALAPRVHALQKRGGQPRARLRLWDLLLDSDVGRRQKALRQLRRRHGDRVSEAIYQDHVARRGRRGGLLGRGEAHCQKKRRRGCPSDSSDHWQAQGPFLCRGQAEADSGMR